MPSTIDAKDGRTGRAVAILAESAQWLHCHLRRPAEIEKFRSAKVYGIPSQSKPGTYVFTNAYWCSCVDQQRHPDLICKHRQAVKLFLAMYRQQQSAVTTRHHRKGLAARGKH